MVIEVKQEEESDIAEVPSCRMHKMKGKQIEEKWQKFSFVTERNDMLLCVIVNTVLIS